MRTQRRAEVSAAPLAPLGDIRFRQLVGAEAWDGLPEAIRRRFSHRSAAGESSVYAGCILETRMTTFGVVVAHLLRLIGGPLPLERNNQGAAAVVTVTERPDGSGQFWTREYVRRRGFPQIVHSTKRFSGATGIEETVGCGVTMSLRLQARPGALFFLSERYFVRLGGLRLPIPGRLLLGDIAVGHIDKGDGSFEFTLEVRHPLLGCFIRQRALFCDLSPEATPA
jgi:hypothetical protein